jgi:hypothetical protein
MFGVQGLYNDGWMPSAVPVQPPWQLRGTAGRRVRREGRLTFRAALRHALFDRREDDPAHHSVYAEALRAVAVFRA